MCSKPITTFQFNVLAVEGRDIYIHRKGWRMGPEINLLMVSEEGIQHYTAIKSLSRLLSSKNSNTKHKRHFCMNLSSLLRGQRNR